MEETMACFDFDEQLLNRTNGEGKWSVRQILHHLCDSELVFLDRMKRIIAGPRQVVWAYDQDLWNSAFGYAQAPLGEKKHLFRMLRQFNMELVDKFIDKLREREFVHSEAGIRKLGEEMERISVHNRDHLHQIQIALGSAGLDTEKKPVTTKVPLWMAMTVHLLIFTFALLIPVTSFSQSQPSYARIALLKPHDGKTVDFEAGYIRHLQWHKQAGDPWVWFGWTVWSSERQRWFMYATFGHSAADFDHPVAPAEDEKDNIINVVPHATFVGNGFYEFLPGVSSGNGVPRATSRVEFITVNLKPGEGPAFEALLRKPSTAVKGEVLWYRLVSGGEAPRYIRIRTVANLEELLTTSGEQSLPDGAKGMIKSQMVEILALRPDMSLGISAQAGK